jgi:hypothetical protein
MTDEQIEKALECCSKAPTELEELYEACANCPYNEQYHCACELATDALAIIKRQKAQLVEQMLTVDAECDKCIAEARTEAIREFAERMSTHIGLLEEKAEEDCAEMCRFLQNATIELHAKRSAYRDVRKCMSETVKEMTEEQK